MRPLRIRMCAFGPYAECQELDFGMLGDKRFFLIHGPTGAGKTSILDAITYALYGDTSGSERDAADMRSDFADASTRTEVTFDFSVGDQVYRVWRAPEQERPKKTGTGTTIDKSQAALWRRTGLADPAAEGDVLAEGTSKVTSAVRELLGFSSEQFRQVVLLPQGRFREVLSADVKTRETILRQLFRTERFATLTEFLKARRNELKTAIEGEQSKRAGALATVGATNDEELRTMAAEAAQAAAAAQDVRAQAVVRADAARAALEKGHAAQAILDEAKAAASALVQLEGRAGEIAEKRASRDAARAAQSVEPAAVLLADKERAVKAARVALDEARAAVPKIEAEWQAACARVEQAESIEKQRAELDKLTARVDAANVLTQRLTALSSASASVTAAEARLEAAREAVVAAASARDGAAADVEALDREWRAAQAAVLAATLADGEACPVCGSHDHPAPAHSATPAPSDDRLSEAAARLDRARAALTAAEREQAAASEGVAAARRAVDERRAELGAHADDDADAAKTQSAELAREHAKLAAQLAGVEHDVATCRAGRDEVAARRSAATTVVEQAEKTLERAETEKTTATEEFDAAIAAAGFEGTEQYLSVKRTAYEIDAIEADINRYETALADAKGRSTRAHEAATGIEAPDLPVLDAAAAEAARLLSDADGAVSAVGARIAQLDKVAGLIADIDAQTGALRERSMLVARLANVADGNNSLKLSLQRYVLGTYLDEVLAHANHRLVRMTGGRYRLQRATGVEDQRKAAGLELEVFDEHTERSRPAATLSGGEGFLASLALALGLAEAVQSHAGGVRLETIFVDEGFGTLDEEALDEAVDTLLELAAGTSQRLVGVISHVPELRNRIDCRLEVVAGPTGSRARFVV